MITMYELPFPCNRAIHPFPMHAVKTTQHARKSMCLSHLK
uniref:Uncharacterized protein n=1 Tax=Arundo donax TaxID=35708 RepID=A0A0A9BDG4_ARUDO